MRQNSLPVAVVLMLCVSVGGAFCQVPQDTVIYKLLEIDGRERTVLTLDFSMDRKGRWPTDPSGI